jgi:serine protease Do
MIDKINNKYLKSIFDISEKNNFNLCYQVHDHDADKSTISIKYNKEDDIKTFEEAPVSVRLSSIIEDFLANASSSGPLPSETALRIEILSDKNKALSHYAAKKQMLTPVNDPRLDSVVVVLNPSGPTGTGFFVKPDHVITNYHIIEGSKFVEMKLHNGLETFGKIVKSDVRLDLALIKVESRGKSIVFRDENKPIEVGATVEAIGHPKGFEFSITRGIVSNFRKADSVFAPGGKQILYIQTDAAISPGNSGGPLFLGEEVIGMNTQKMVANAVEGLGFAIHFSEILTFLEKDF